MLGGNPCAEKYCVGNALIFFYAVHLQKLNESVVILKTIENE